VASLYEVTRQHPKTWGGPWNIDRCIEKWNEDVGRTLSYVDVPNHFLVRYEELVDRPEAILRALCGFIGIGFHSDMLEDHARAAHSVILREETWKLRAAAPVSRTPSNKFDSLFDEGQRAYILDRLIRPECLRPQSASSSQGRMTAAEGVTACC
jgi:hypothetical protein